MSNSLKQAVLLWGLVLLLMLWLGFFQSSWTVKFTVAVVFTAVAAMLTYFLKKEKRAVAESDWLSQLPPETYRLPVVLVCGDAAARLFSESPLRLVAEGIFLHVPDEEQLAPQMAALLATRPAWASQTGVAYTVIPGFHRDPNVLAGKIRRFASVMGQVRRKTGTNVPLLLWSYLPGSDPAWLMCAGGEVKVVASSGENVPAEWIAQTDEETGRQRFCHLLGMENLRHWLSLNVLPELAKGKCSPSALGVGLTPSLPEVTGNLWRTWLTARTGLTTEAGSETDAQSLPFPYGMLSLLPRRSGFTPVRRASVLALMMATVAGVTAFGLSATSNRSLLRQISDDLHRYHAVPMDDFMSKARFLSVLKGDAEVLDVYYREGEPIRLGMGLYPGEQLRQPVLRAIRDYRMPEAKVEVPASVQVQTVRLDSMALFDVGQARLKSGSTKVLVDALVNIKAKPGWLILVAGYTDATGDEQSNRQLSLRRAEAVRDWMLQTSDIPSTCFAVQGLGESQPAATNDTPEGRAANRRVEISLVPRSDACQDVEQKMPPEAAVSYLYQQGE